MREGERERGRERERKRERETQSLNDLSSIPGYSNVRRCEAIVMGIKWMAKDDKGW